MAFNLGLTLALGSSTGTVVSTDAPVNTVAPSISGIQTQGQTVSAGTGSWSGPPTSFTYQWQRAGVNIGGATSPSYLLTGSDVGQTITAEVTGLNHLGSAMAETAGITPAAVLSITGTPAAATQGSSYTFTPATSGGHTAYAYSLTGTLPTGLSFNTSTGAITGTPTTLETASGLDITVTDADGLTDALGAFYITVSEASSAAAGAPLGLLLLLTQVTSGPSTAGHPTGLLLLLTKAS